MARTRDHRGQYANKGQGFELVLSYTNDAYLAAGLAVVRKVPTEWRILGDWRKGPVPVFPVQKGPCDYLGFTLAGNSHGLAIEAKESENLTSFPFDFEWNHEVEFLRQASRHNAAAFMLIYQKAAGRTWYLPGAELFKRWDAAFTGQRLGRKSIPWKDLEEGAGLLVPSAPAFPVHYLKCLQ